MTFHGPSSERRRCWSTSVSIVVPSSRAESGGPVDAGRWPAGERVQPGEVAPSSQPTGPRLAPGVVFRPTISSRAASWRASWRPTSCAGVFVAVPPLAVTASRRIASSSKARAGRHLLDPVALADRGVGLAVGDVHAEPAVLGDDRALAHRVGAELAQRALGGHVAAATLEHLRAAGRSSTPRRA